MTILGTSPNTGFPDLERLCRQPRPMIKNAMPAPSWLTQSRRRPGCRLRIGRGSRGRAVHGRQHFRGSPSDLGLCELRRATATLGIAARGR